MPPVRTIPRMEPLIQASTLCSCADCHRAEAPLVRVLREIPAKGSKRKSITIQVIVYKKVSREARASKLWLWPASVPVLPDHQVFDSACYGIGVAISCVHQAG